MYKFIYVYKYIHIYMKIHTYMWISKYVNVTIIAWHSQPWHSHLHQRKKLVTNRPVHHDVHRQTKQTYC